MKNNIISVKGANAIPKDTSCDISRKCATRQTGNTLQDVKNKLIL